MLLVTGSSGLIGSEVAERFYSMGWFVPGVDHNLRGDSLRPPGDTRRNQCRLHLAYPNSIHHELDTRDRAALLGPVEHLSPSAIVPRGVQPSRWDNDDRACCGGTTEEFSIYQSTS